MYIRKYISRFFLGAALFLLSGCGGDEVIPYSVKLEVWGVFDDSDALQEAFSGYKQVNPYVKEISYRKMNPETYRADLLDALASGKGPDIFMIQNTWKDDFTDKVVPAPTLFTTEKKFRETFVDVVADDFLGSQGEVYAAPLSVDSLALYYNKDIFNAAGIAEPPKTWEDLVAIVKKLTEIDQYGNINRSAIAMGTGENINRSVDLLLLLMMQMGVDVRDENFATAAEARKAFEFYSQFSRINSPLYTWSPREHYSIDAFYEGTLGMTVNYSYHYDTFRQKNAKLNFAAAPLPQFSGQSPVNFANYWGFTVAKNKIQPTEIAGQAGMATDQYQAVRVHESWQLIHYLTFPHPNNQLTLYNALSPTSGEVVLKNDPAVKYLEKTKRPTARRDLISTQQDNIALAPFVQGNLIAKSWKPGSNAVAAESLLVDAINAVNRGERTVVEALSVFDARVGQFR